MIKAQKVERYIKECFDELSINYKEYFYYDYEDNGNYEDIYWIDESGNINMDAVAHASKILGISVADILSTNEGALLKWLKKYRYFWDIKPFYMAYKKSLCDDSFDTCRLMEVVFDIEDEVNYNSCFNYEDITKRLIMQLRDIDKLLPGTFHHGAQIMNLHIETSRFCRFDNIKEMTESYICMVNTVTNLFLKAIQSELTENEVQEYNLLVSALGLRDPYYTKGYLYYDGLVKAKDTYRTVTSENFNEFVIMKHWKNFQPWRCANFINDRELVERYLSVVPQAKAEMSKYAMSISHFVCDFVWSDAKAMVDSPEIEALCDSIYEIVGEAPVPIKERPKEHTTLYVKKTVEELFGDDVTAKKITEYCRPEKLGGIPVKAFLSMSDFSMTNSIKRITALLGKISSNNFVQSIVDEANTSRGGNI